MTYAAACLQSLWLWLDGEIDICIMIPADLTKCSSLVHYCGVSVSALLSSRVFLVSFLGTRRSVVKGANNAMFKYDPACFWQYLKEMYVNSVVSNKERGISTPLFFFSSFKESLLKCSCMVSWLWAITSKILTTLARTWFPSPPHWGPISETKKTPPSYSQNKHDKIFMDDNEHWAVQKKKERFSRSIFDAANWSVQTPSCFFVRVKIYKCMYVAVFSVLKGNW